MRDLDEEHGPGVRSACDFSPELTRPFRGLRLWLPLKVHGVAPFRAAMDEKLLLTDYLYERLQSVDGIEVGPPPDLSIVVFRVAGDDETADRQTQALVGALRRSGAALLSTTVLNGRLALRFAVMALRTHRESIDAAVEAIAAEVRALPARTSG